MKYKYICLECSGEFESNSWDEVHCPTCDSYSITEVGTAAQQDRDRWFALRVRSIEKGSK